MPNNISYSFQTTVKDYTISLQNLYREAKDIYSAYFKTEASTYVGGKGSSDPVTVNTKLTKTQFINGITYCENVVNFFGNSAVTTGDYLTNINALKYGNTSGATDVPVSVESLGTRMYNVAIESIRLYNTASNQLKVYTSTGLSTIAGVLADEVVVFGSDMTIADMKLVNDLMHEWVDFLSNAAVTTADYYATLAQWQRLTPP